MPKTIQDITASFKPWDGKLPPLGHVVVQAYRYANQKQTKQRVVAHCQDVKPARSWGEGMLQLQRKQAPFTIKDGNKPSQIAWDEEAAQILKHAPQSVAIAGPYCDLDELNTLLNVTLPATDLDKLLGVKPTPAKTPTCATATPTATEEFDPFGL